MDIAKYAGLFFLRSEYIYLPGIGNLEIKKSPSYYDSESRQVLPGEASVTFKPSVGVIDDAFANFVANNERISIASAANAISDFGLFVKRAVADNTEVEIPAIGHFFNNNGTIDFRINEKYVYVPKSIPIFKNVSRTEEFAKEKDIKTIIETTEFKIPNAHEEIELEKPKVNYGKLTLLILIAVLVLGAISYIVFQVINENASDDTKPKTEVKKDIDPAEVNQVKDSINLATGVDTMSSTVAPQSGTDYKVIVNEYKALSTAETRKKKLESFAYNSEIHTKDSVTYYVVVNIPKSNGDEQVVIDSIKKLLNPRFDVRLYQ